MRYLYLIALVSALFSAVLTSAQPASGDAILIVGISPTSFEDGRETQVEVAVAYELTSADEAMLDLSSNELGAQIFHPIAHARIKRGTGATTISGKLVPRYWTPGAPAKVAVHLVRQTNLGSGRQALATDNVRIAVAQRPGSPETDSQNPNPVEIYSDAITIKSVKPATLIEGQETEIVVTVAYELVSREEGEINLGYSRGRGNGYTIIGKTQVKMGKGEAAVLARIVPVPTGNLPFSRIFVNLSEFPHRPNWVPLANDSHTLEIR